MEPFPYRFLDGCANRRSPFGWHPEPDYCTASYIPECRPTIRQRFAYLFRKLPRHACPRTISVAIEEHAMATAQPMHLNLTS